LDGGFAADAVAGDGDFLGVVSVECAAALAERFAVETGAVIGLQRVGVARYGLDPSLVAVAVLARRGNRG